VPAATPPPLPQIDTRVTDPLGAAATGYGAPVTRSAAGWHSVGIGLGAAVGGAVVGIISSVMLGLGRLVKVMIYFTGTDPSASLFGTVDFLTGVGSIGLYSSLIMALTSWSVCLAVPDVRHKPPLQAAILVTVIALVILASFFIFFDEDLLDPVVTEPTAKVLVTAFVLGVACAFCGFSAFVRGVALQLSLFSVASGAVGHMVFVGCLAGWYLLSLFAFAELAKGEAFDMINPFVMLIGIAVHFFWTIHLARRVRRVALRRHQTAARAEVSAG
jgi:hypothetical protein